MIKWGILGCGNIANKFAEAVNKSVAGAELVGAGARDLSKAQSFAKKHKISRAYGSYLDLVQDQDIDAVYIATPHSHHKEHTLLCFEHNKAVVCEKPLAINEDEVKDMISSAKEKNLFFMEALWMRFLPVMGHLKKLISDGSLGSVKNIDVDFSFKAKFNKEGRLFNPHLAGGALLDVGIYPLAFSLMVFDETPLTYSGVANVGATKVDESNSFKLEFSNNRFAQCTSAVVENGSKLARVEFEDAVVELPNFWQGEKINIKSSDSKSKVEKINLPFDLNGFEYEIREAVECIEEGKTECNTMPFSESLKIIRIMDGLRNSWDLTYPMEVNSVGTK